MKKTPFFSNYSVNNFRKKHLQRWQTPETPVPARAAGWASGHPRTPGAKKASAGQGRSPMSWWAEHYIELQI